MMGWRLPTKPQVNLRVRDWHVHTLLSIDLECARSASACARFIVRPNRGAYHRRAFGTDGGRSLQGQEGATHKPVAPPLDRAPIQPRNLTLSFAEAPHLCTRAMLEISPIARSVSPFYYVQMISLNVGKRREKPVSGAACGSFQ
jgi:hypothetical protein